MSCIVPVKLPPQHASRSYNIHIGSKLLEQTGPLSRPLAPAEKAVVISDETVAPLYAEPVLKSLKDAGYTAELLTVPAGEASKSLPNVERLCRELAKKRLERSSPIFALGGGMVGDLTGFVAAVFLRGVPFFQLPTTILADVDSSIGGKTAVNIEEGKNLIGAFYQPKAVIMDVDTLQSLPSREVVSGLAESIKHGLIRDPDHFATHEKHLDALLKLDPCVLVPLLERNCRIKAGVVEADEREADLRTILNFGHTIGHAVETLGGYDRYLHGEAVALGILGALHLAVARGMIETDLLRRVEKLLGQMGLPLSVPDLDPTAALDVMRRDKKVHAGRIRFILPTQLGRVTLIDNLTDAEIRHAVQAISK